MQHRLSGLLGALVLCAGSGAQAAIVHLEGATVDFYYDDAQPGMAAYGALSAIGDSIFATPTTFIAESLNGTGDSFSALGTVQVVLKSGYRFDSVQVAQRGDYLLNGAGASVSVSGDLTIEDSSNPATALSTTMTSSSDFTINDNALHAWSSSGAFDVSSWTTVTSVDLSLDTMLLANTGAAGERAYIEKKFTGGGLVTIMTTPIPVPAAVWLFGSGLIALTGFARRPRNG